MSQLLRNLSLTGVLLAGLSTFAADAKDYAIQLTRKATVGEHYGFLADSSQEQLVNVSVDGQAMPPRTVVTKVLITAAGEVLALTPAGRETKARFVIEKAVVSTGGPSVELLPPGTEVVAEQTGGKTAFLVGGVPAKREIAHALDVAGIEMASDEIASDDQIFGTSARRKVGDSWPVNATAAAADLTKKGVTVEPGNLTGTTTLAEIVRSDNQDALRITSTMAMKNVTPPLPPGIVVQSGEFNAAFFGIFPVDVTKRVIRSNMTMDGKFVCAGKTGDKDVAMTLTMKQSKDVTFSGK